LPICIYICFCFFRLSFLGVYHSGTGCNGVTLGLIERSEFGFASARSLGGFAGLLHSEESVIYTPLSGKLGKNLAFVKFITSFITSTRLVTKTLRACLSFVSSLQKPTKHEARMFLLNSSFDIISRKPSRMFNICLF